jgi:hypothetical protein
MKIAPYEHINFKYTKSIFVKANSIKTQGGFMFMLRDFAWKAFESTGDIEAYKFYKEIQKNANSINESKIAEEEAATTNGQ